jgi:hypothetical protein
MQLKLKEKPAEWIKFACAIGVVGNALVWFAARKGVWATQSALVFSGVTVGLLFAAALRPRVLRPFYRIGMTAGFYVGRTLGIFWLALLYVVAVIPLGLVLRVAGIDPLHWRRPRPTDTATYWRKASPHTDLRRQF